MRTQVMDSRGTVVKLSRSAAMVLVVLLLSLGGPLVGGRLEVDALDSHPVDLGDGDTFLLGLYTSGPLQSTADEISAADRWLEGNGLARRVALAGTFMDLEFPNPEWNVSRDLDAAWDRGYVPFVNLAVGTTGLGPRTAEEVARGAIDGAIRRWARVFAGWATEGGKVAYIAPLQEMNGSWVSYGLEPGYFVAAYRRIQGIFADEGVPAGSVQWVFAPNGWSRPEHAFERYYPGDAYVDVVGFSAFNFGACAAGEGAWRRYAQAIAPYVDRMRAMAPEKPILVAQMGTVDSGGSRGRWIGETLQRLAGETGVAGMIYFNVAKVEAGAPNCSLVDWRLFDPDSGLGSADFLEALRGLEAPETLGLELAAGSMV